MESQQKQPDFLVGFACKKDNGYLGEFIGVSGVVHLQTQLIDALIESYSPLETKTAVPVTTASL